MKYLTLDTTTKVMAISLAEDGCLVAEGFLNTAKTHSEQLIPLLDRLLEASAWSLRDLELIGAVRGPGSFTGIRIGIATAQGLAQVLGIPLLGVLSLEALVWAGIDRKEDIVPVLDARKNEWYTARYRWEAGKIQCLTPPQALRPDEWLEQLKELGRPICFVGDGVLSAGVWIKEFMGEQAVVLPEYLSLPRGAYGARAVWQRWQEFCSGKQEQRALGVLEPYYIRRSEAEVNWEKKQEAVRRASLPARGAVHE